jgi:hypothetical protein
MSVAMAVLNLSSYTATVRLPKRVSRTLIMICLWPFDLFLSLPSFQLQLSTSKTIVYLQLVQVFKVFHGPLHMISDNTSLTNYLTSWRGVAKCEHELLRADNFDVG